MKAKIMKPLNKKSNSHKTKQSQFFILKIEFIVCFGYVLKLLQMPLYLKTQQKGERSKAKKVLTFTGEVKLKNAKGNGGADIGVVRS